MGHGHGHGPAPPASRRVRMLLATTLAPVALTTLIGLWLTWPGGTPGGGVDAGFGQRPVRGEVLARASAPCTKGVGGSLAGAQAKRCISLDVTAHRWRLTGGDDPAGAARRPGHATVRGR